MFGRSGAVRAAVLAALALLQGAALAAQDAQLRGAVREAAGGAPVAEAEVLVAAQGRRSLAGADGRFSLMLVPGAVEVSVRRIGFAPVTLRLALGAGEVREIEVALAPAATTLDPVVVTATREERGLAEVPASVAVVDSTTLKAGRSAGLHEALRYAPGIQAQSRYGGDDVNLSIRGSGIRTTFGVRGVAVLMDGVPITEPDGLTRLDLLELATARQVEVVRGPASALYGGVASGGAVNVISRSGADSRGGTLRVQRGDFGFRKADGYVGDTFAGGRGSAIVSGAYTWLDGYRRQNWNEMWRFNLRADYRVAPATRVALDASTSNLDMRIPGALTRAEYDADPSLAAPVNVTNNYARRDERYRLGLRLEQALGGAARVQTASYAFYGGRTLDHPIFQVVDQNLHRVQLGTRARVAVDRPDDPRLTAVVGVDYDNLFGTDRRWQNVRGERGTLLADGYLSLPSVGLYAQAEARVAPSVTVTAGLRRDAVRYELDNYLTPALSATKSFGQWSPKATVSWRATGSATVYASVARGFEVPTTGELTVSPDPAKPVNDALRPKSLWNYEVGAKALLGRRAWVDAAFFVAKVRGEFLSRTIPTATGPRQVYENAGRSRNVGVEVGATVLAASWLDVTGSWTWADYVLTEFASAVVNAQGQSVLTDFAGRRLPGVPVHRVGGELRARPLRHVTAGVGAEWQSRTYVDNANAREGTVYFRSFGSTAVQAAPYRAVPAYALVHLNASWQLGPATLFGSVENLLDTRYVANITINDGQGRFYNPGAGRFVTLGVSAALLPGGF